MNTVEAARTVIQTKTAHHVRFNGTDYDVRLNEHEPRDEVTVAFEQGLGITTRLPKTGWVILDYFTASAILAVYDKLSKESNKARMASMRIEQAASIAFRLMNPK